MQTMLPGGIYPPLPTFFDALDELDLATLRLHMQRLAGSGIAGYVLMGSNGEAVHLTDDERARVLTVAHETIQQFEQPVPLIVGCGAQSTRGTIAYCQQAAHYGANFALILPPSYYRRHMHNAAMSMHYRTVADQSPLPILIYNMPASAAGIDLDADTICALSEHQNIAGLKDSSGNISKLARIVAITQPTFRVFAGSADFLLPALVAGAIGAVAALANVFPDRVCRVQGLFEQGKLEEARIRQARLIPANTAVTGRYGIAGLKAALTEISGYGGLPRLPLQALTPQEHSQLLQTLSQLSQDS